MQDISYPQALGIGLCQALAVIPGVSRSAATIVGGLAAGVERAVIVEFSFLLAVPTMLAATIWDLLKTEAVLDVHAWGLLAVGFIVAFMVAWFAVKFFLQYVRKHDLVAFGVYRVVAAVLLLLFLR